ncbi:MAG: hypothetical protein HZB17_14920 [Chloroflexi bacterium]|nr:hypothetical protein [Chloroflexota bacterium]
MLTFTFAGDEAGDASLNFEKGASSYFVVTVVATQDADALRSVLEHFPVWFKAKLSSFGLFSGNSGNATINQLGICFNRLASQGSQSPSTQSTSPTLHNKRIA